MAARLAFKTRARDIDAPGGKEFLLHREVQSGESEAAARACAGDHFTGESKGSAEKARGMRNVAGGDFPANDGAGDYLSAINHRRNDNDLELVFCTQLGKQFHVARLLVPEPEIFTEQNSLDMQIADENLLDKFLGGQAREVQCERQ